MTKKIKNEIEINGDKANSKAIYVNQKVFNKESVIKVLKKLKPEEKPEPVNKYNIKNNILKNKQLVNIKILGLADGVRIVYRENRREIIGEPPLQVILKTKELELGILARARKRASKHYKSKKGLYSFLFLAANLFIFLGILIHQKNTIGVISIETLFASALKLEFLLYAFLSFVIIMVLEALRTHVLIYQTTKISKPLLCYKAAVTNIYYENVIPMGGKPFEVLYLSNRGIKTSIATSVPLAKYVFATLASVILSTIAIISKWSFLQESSEIILILGVAMLACNLFLVVILVLFASSHKLAPRIVYRVLRILYALRIVKNPRENFTKIMRFVLEYQKSIQYFVKTKSIAVISMVCSLLINILGALLPFLIYCAFATPSFEIMLDLILKFYIMKITTFFFPIPGGVGVSEISFAALFATYFEDGLLFWAVMLFRIFSYFIYLLQGMIVVSYDIIINKRKGTKMFYEKDILDI